jgi:hypothetical protein
MRRSAGAIALALLAISAAASPAGACHHFAIWHFPHPQACPLAHRARYRAQAPLVPMAPAGDWPPALRRALARMHEIALPDLSAIDWGAVADDQDRGRLMLHALFQQGENQ